MCNTRVAVASGALAVLVALAAGCGSSSPKAASNASTTTAGQAGSTTSTIAVASTTTTVLKDPCTYVTKAEVASATGKSVIASAKSNDFVCGYSTSDTGTVNIGVAGGITRAIVEGQLEAETAAGTLPPTMAGIGDVAYRTLGGVAVVKGTKSVRVTVFGSGSYAPDGNAGAVSLARLILSRI